MRRDWLAYLALTMTALFFAGNTIVGRAAAGELPPMGLAFWRSFGALLFLLPFGLPEIWALRREVLAAWRILLVLGLLGMTAFSTLFFAGLQYTEAINGSLIQGTLPLNIVIVSLIFLGTALNARQTLGLIAGGLGFALIVLRGEISRISALGLNIGDGMIWIGVLCYALFSILLPRRPLMLGLPAFLTVIFFIGSVTTFPFHAWEIARGDGMPLTWIGLGAAIYVGLFASLFAQLFWAFGVARVGPTKAGYFIRHSPYAIQIRGNRTTFPPPRELYPLCSHPMA